MKKQKILYYIIFILSKKKQRYDVKSLFKLKLSLLFKILCLCLSKRTEMYIELLFVYHINKISCQTNRSYLMKL